MLTASLYRRCLREEKEVLKGGGDRGGVCGGDKESFSLFLSLTHAYTHTNPHTYKHT